MKKIMPIKFDADTEDAVRNAIYTQLDFYKSRKIVIAPGCHEDIEIKQQTKLLKAFLKKIGSKK